MLPRHITAHLLASCRKPPTTTTTPTIFTHLHRTRQLCNNNNNNNKQQPETPETTKHESSAIFAQLHAKYKDLIDKTHKRTHKRLVVRSAAKIGPRTVLGDSQNAVRFAILGNATIAAVKLTAHFATGSSTMLSEGIHSLADTLNQSLLAIGIARAKRPASPEYPYGHAREAYVWALVSAVGIFFLGAGVTITDGIRSFLSHEHAVENIEWCMGALALSFIVESLTLLTALAAVRRGAKAQQMKLSEYIIRGPDPTAVAVLLEDGAAVLGVAIAASCIGLCHVTNSDVWDCVGSVAIGVLLGGVAIFLIRKNRELLIGRGVPLGQRARFLKVVKNDSMVRSVSDVKAEILGVGVMRLKAEIKFDGKAVTRKHIANKLNIHEVCKQYGNNPQAMEQFLVVFGDEVIHQLSDEIDRLENEIVKELPEAAHVDLEAD